jgi:hypothetical protein
VSANAAFLSRRSIDALNKQLSAASLALRTSAGVAAKPGQLRPRLILPLAAPGAAPVRHSLAEAKRAEVLADAQRLAQQAERLRREREAEASARRAAQLALRADLDLQVASKASKASQLAC